MAINKIQGNILSDNLIRGSNLAFQTDLIYLDIINGRVGVNTTTTSRTLTVDGDARIGNIEIYSGTIGSDSTLILAPTGNVSASNVNINNLANPAAASDAATKFYVDSKFGNLVISNITITSSLANANIVIAPTGTGLAVINTTTGLVLPTGNTAQQPSPAVIGTVRFDTDVDRVQVYDGTSWADLVANVTNQVLYGDNSTLTFTLDKETTAASALIAFNGVIQLPGVAYTVTGNQITFSQAPAISDVIDIRFL